MMDLKEYRKISLEFRRVASNLLKTDYRDGNVPLIRFKKYIDNTETIKTMIDNKISNVEYDCNQFIKNDSGWNYINTPILEEEHIKAMYDYMTYLIDNNISVERIALGFLCDSKKITAHIQYFIDQAFKPLIDFINDGLSAIIIMLEEEKMGINVSNNHGIVNVANNNSNIESDNIINYNDLSEISKIISTIIDNLKQIDISDEERENITDDMEVIKEQLECSIEKPARLKKAFANIKSFLTNAALLTSTGITLSTNIQHLISLVQPIVDKL